MARFLILTVRTFGWIPNNRDHKVPHGNVGDYHADWKLNLIIIPFTVMINRKVFGAKHPQFES